MTKDLFLWKERGERFMPKCKSKIKEHQMWVVVKLSFKEKFDERQIDILQRNCVNGLLKLKERKANAIELLGPTGISLAEWMKNPISKNDFFYVMAQITELIRLIPRSGLNLSNVIFDKKHIYINQNTRMLQFVYAPVSTKLYGENHIVPLLEEICSVKALKEEDMHYARRFKSFLQDAGKYDGAWIERYIQNEAPGVINALKKHTFYKNGFNANDEKTELLSANLRVNDESEESTILLQTAMEVNADYEEATMPLQSVADENDCGEETTTLLQTSQQVREENAETAPLLQASMEIDFSTPAYLYRVKTGEKISIDKPIIRIGKEPKSCDYCVLDNGRVSRIHADIIKRGAEWYLCDLGAVNRTYLEGEVLLPSREYPLAAGQHIKLADEEFVVYIK